MKKEQAKYYEIQLVIENPDLKMLEILERGKFQVKMTKKFLIIESSLN